MRYRWTRKTILQEIIQREADGKSLSAGREGVDSSLYQAAKRLYGSWQKALLAAGIAPHQAMPTEKWPAQKILNTLRHLAKRKRPVNIAKVSKRYRGLVAAARRVFGSWPKALAAAGVDPAKFSCVTPWSRERVIEAILTRAIRNEPLGSRTTQPRRLVDAGERIFGTWAAAKKAAGVGNSVAGGGSVSNSVGNNGIPASKIPVDMPSRANDPCPIPVHRPRQRWTAELVFASMRARLDRGQRLNAAAVNEEYPALYRAATRRFGRWANALLAAGINPSDAWHQGVPPDVRQQAPDAQGLTEGAINPVDVSSYE